jgi:hypothetical protein
VIDKADLKVPYSASFRAEFRFIPGELRFAGYGSMVRRSQHYQGVIDLRPFGLDAVLHAYFRHCGCRNHKLELIDAGEKSLDQMGHIVSRVFEVDPDQLQMMRVDFASDIYGIPVRHFYESLRVKQKRSADTIGELDFETVGGRRLEYFRYGKSPNCVRVYDKVAESRARMPQILKRVSPDAEVPTFEDLFGFPPNVTLTRVERQAGGGRIPEQVSTFGNLRNATDFDPFGNVEIVRNEFPFPDPQRVGPARALKLIGTNEYVKRLGYQQARAALNCDRNAKRYFDDLDTYHSEVESSIEVTVDTIRESYRKSVQAQIDGSIEVSRKTVSNPYRERELSRPKQCLTVPRG